MLYIGFHALVARKGDVHAGEGAGLEMLLPLGLIEEVAAEVALAEEQPGAPAGAPRLPLLQEGTVRRHACAGADHDGRHVVGGQPEMGIALDIDGQGRAHLSPVGEMSRSDARAARPVQAVADRRYGQVHDRKSVLSGEIVYVLLVLGGRRYVKKK